MNIGRARRLRSTAAVFAAVAALTMLTAACGTGDPAPRASGSSPPVSGISATAGADPALAEQVPSAIRSAGRLVAATGSHYAPMVYADEQGTLTGFDVELMTAIADLLDLELEVKLVPFDQILPGVAAGRFDVGMDGIFDTLARQKTVDMVTYLRGGTQWIQRAGEDVDPNNACGRRVAAASGNLQATVELPAKSKACETVGDKPITIVAAADQDGARRLLYDRKVDAVSADAAVAAVDVRDSDGRLADAGRGFDSQPYGLPVARGSDLGPVLRAAVQKLIDDGRLAAIAADWGLSDELIDDSVINGATQ